MHFIVSIHLSFIQYFHSHYLYSQYTSVTIIIIIQGHCKLPLHCRIARTIISIILWRSVTPSIPHSRRTRWRRRILWTPNPTTHRHTCSSSSTRRIRRHCCGSCLIRIPHIDMRWLSSAATVTHIRSSLWCCTILIMHLYLRLLLLLLLQASPSPCTVVYQEDQTDHSKGDCNNDYRPIPFPT